MHKSFAYYYVIVLNKSMHKIQNKNSMVRKIISMISTVMFVIIIFITSKYSYTVKDTVIYIYYSGKNPKCKANIQAKREERIFIPPWHPPSRLGQVRWLHLDHRKCPPLQDRSQRPSCVSNPPLKGINACLHSLQELHLVMGVTVVNCPSPCWEALLYRI